MSLDSGDVQVRVEDRVIPTYAAGEPDKNPMFLENRVYQGSSGVIYPHPIVESVSDEKTDKTYTAIFLENKYLEIMLLPELGGRVQMARDKTNGFHFVYYNRVIKPALVGLTGPWISGGIEFNWPQHHRPSTFQPVDYRINKNADGSITVWFSEIERMFRSKGMVGFTLYPEHAYLELDVRLYNRSPFPQTFLWWANPAVHVNDDYQSVFPPDVRAVMDHGKRDSSDFPIATGSYYKYDYSPGTDISRYKNIPVPTSYMAYHSDYDFLGSYDHGRRAGMMHVANHHLVPGKKQWTWGNGDFGRAWDRQLTDEDGPYIELMCGAFTDNQPDFSWLMPGEEKRFQQVFMPYKKIGPVKNASKDALINLDVADDLATIGVYLTSARTVTIELGVGDIVLFQREMTLSPERSHCETITLPAGTAAQALNLSVIAEGKTLVSYSPERDERADIPAPASAAKPPREIASNDELYLNGLHLEQYRHATCQPEPYYLEALRRDPLDSRCNNAMGLLLLRRGIFVEAEAYFRTAVESLARRNPNPYDGEAHYNLGLSLKFQGRFQEAADAFYKSVWNAAWSGAGYFELARLESRRGRYADAIDLAQLALDYNRRHHRARHLMVALLRRDEAADCALSQAGYHLSLDRMDFGAAYELYLLTGDAAYRESLGGRAHNYIELALDYAHAGLFEEALDLLSEAPADDPMALYYLGWCRDQRGEAALALSAFEQAARMPPDYCFPNRLECIAALTTAMRLNPADAKAPYYLGNFWYAYRQYEDAIGCWERSLSLDADNPTAHRNLGLALMNKRGDSHRALQHYQRAFALDESDARVLFELDQLFVKMGKSPSERLAFLQGHQACVDRRDDLTIEMATLLNLLGRPADALDIIMNRVFHPWEGGEGKVTGQYVTSLTQLAREQIRIAEYDRAIDCLNRARSYPHNLGEGKLLTVPENDVFYYLGLAYDLRGDAETARLYYEGAARGAFEPASPKYYNDQPPEMIYYQGLARRKLGEHDLARSIFQRLIEYGEAHLHDDVTMDYFAVSLPNFLVFEDDLSQRNHIHCLYLIALGHLGLGDHDTAQRYFDDILARDPNHLGATIHRQVDAAGFAAKVGK
ncbi:MAG: DUF5107 domain-containing protein [Chloroflexi bacterium]|nr:DUF5107 domain-containing protein [Chloroflexota bacterium]